MQAFSKWGLLLSLYLSQGLPYGFYTQALPAMMREQGESLPKIALTSLLALPWALKFLWAPVVDKYSISGWGRRKSWIVPLQFLSLCTLVLLGALRFEDHLFWIMAGFLVVNLFTATQDIATDALAVSLLSHSERGVGNGIQVAGYRLGMIIGGGILLVTMQSLGWSVTLMLMAAILLLALIPVLKFKEPLKQMMPKDSKKNFPVNNLVNNGAKNTKNGGVQERVDRGLSSWTGFFKRDKMLGWGLVLVAYKGIDAMASVMVKPFLIDSGLTLSQIGWLVGSLGFLGGLAGALLGGAAIEKIGRIQALIGFGLFQAFAIALYIPAAMGFVELNYLSFAITIESAAGGMATAALFTAMMDVSHSDTGATDYTLQASLVVIASGTMASLSGWLAQGLGYLNFFSWVCVLCIAVMVPISIYLRNLGEPFFNSSQSKP